MINFNNTNFMRILRASFILLFIVCSPCYAEESIQYANKAVKIGSNSIKLNYLVIPDSNLYSIEAANSNPIGSVSELKTLVTKKNVIAGINGTFFDAYNNDSSKRYPNGIIINNNKIIHGGSNVCFFSDGKNKVGSLNIKIRGAINGSYKWPNNWNGWSINHVYNTPYQSVILDSNFGSIPNDGSTNIIVNKNGIVEDIQTKPVKIPAGGYVIHIGNKESTRTRFKIGDSVEYKIEYELNGQPLIANTIEYAIGAGPKLITKGKYDVNYERDGFTSEKIKSMRSSRSFIGINKNGAVIMGTTPSASISELAKALISLGLTDAMNLDGGASSGLYYNGKYITKPGRLISNAIVIVKRSTETTNINFNGSILEHKGIIKDGKTYVPLRGILEQLGIEVGWNKENESAICTKGSKTIEIPVGNTPDAKGFMLNSKSYIPIKLISDYFGYTCYWDNNTKQVIILN